jgi:GDPmannose 4,6-dehydratase
MEMAFRELDMELEWRGEGANEVGVERSTGKTLVEIDPDYFRPAEVDVLKGDAGKARKKLGWSHRYELEDLVREMVRSDHAHCQRAYGVKPRKSPEG